MTAASAWLVSGALMKPSVLAQVTPALKGLQLVHGSRFDKTVHDQLADQRGHAVVSQSPRVNGSRHKRMPQSVHGEQWGHLNCVAEVVSKRPFGHGGARGWFDSDDVDLFPRDLVSQEREGQACEVAPTASATYDDIGVVAGLDELFLSFLTDDCLVKKHVVQHAPEGVACRRTALGLTGHRVFHRLTDCNAETARRIGVLGKNLTAGLGFGAGAGNTCRSPCVHHEAAIRLLLITYPDHVDFCLQSELIASERQSASPLPRACLSGDSLDAENFVVVDLGYGCVGLVTPGRANTFVLVVNLYRAV